MSDAPDAPVARETRVLMERAVLKVRGVNRTEEAAEALRTAVCATVNEQVGGGDLASLAERLQEQGTALTELLNAGWGQALREHGDRLDDVAGWQEGILARLEALEKTRADLAWIDESVRDDLLRRLSVLEKDHRAALDMVTRRLGVPDACEECGGPWLTFRANAAPAAPALPVEGERERSLRIADRVANEYERQTGHALSPHVLVEALGAAELLRALPPEQPPGVYSLRHLREAWLVEGFATDAQLAGHLRVYASEIEDDTRGESRAPQAMRVAADRIAAFHSAPVAPPLPALHEVRETDVICCCGDHLRPTGLAEVRRLVIERMEACEAVGSDVVATNLGWVLAVMDDRLGRLEAPAPVGTLTGDELAALDEADRGRVAWGRDVAHRLRVEASPCHGAGDRGCRLMLEAADWIERGAPAVGAEVVAWRWRFHGQPDMAWSLARENPGGSSELEVQPLGVIGPVEERLCERCHVAVTDGALLCAPCLDRCREEWNSPVEERAGTAGEDGRAEDGYECGFADAIQWVQGEMDATDRARMRGGRKGWLRRTSGLAAREPSAPTVEAGLQRDLDDRVAEEDAAHALLTAAGVPEGTLVERVETLAGWRIPPAVRADIESSLHTAGWVRDGEGDCPWRLAESRAVHFGVSSAAAYLLRRLLAQRGPDHTATVQGIFRQLEAAGAPGCDDSNRPLEAILRDYIAQRGPEGERLEGYVPNWTDDAERGQDDAVHFFERHDDDDGGEMWTPATLILHRIVPPEGRAEGGRDVLGDSIRVGGDVADGISGGWSGGSVRVLDDALKGGDPHEPVRGAGEDQQRAHVAPSASAQAGAGEAPAGADSFPITEAEFAEMKARSRRAEP